MFRHGGLSHSLLGGWQVSGITNFATGSPFSVIYNAIDNAGVGNGDGSDSYADIVSNPKVTPHPVNQYGRQYYNQAAYAVPTALTFGDSGRNSLRNPDFINFDMAVFKHFTIKESTAIEFRAEAFNVFNHEEWAPDCGPVRRRSQHQRLGHKCTRFPLPRATSSTPAECTKRASCSSR